MILSFKKVGHQVFNSQAFFADFSILQIQVPQELQNEEVKWTKAYRRLHGKDMTQDSTFEFERKRNRNLAENTLKAIKKIDKVRSDRAANHIEKRLKVRKGKERREAQKELEQSIHLVKAPQVLRQDQSLTLPKIKVQVSQPKSEQNQAMEE
uniref:Ribosome biogenesis protein RLP24 n=1 Tax=Populus trichocarpa TaxID=3694 RepID=A0A2K1Z839_POPTR